MAIPGFLVLTSGRVFYLARGSSEGRRTLQDPSLARRAGFRSSAASNLNFRITFDQFRLTASRRRLRAELNAVASGLPLN